MISPEDRKRMVGKLTVLWETFPQLRLGQLVNNLCETSPNGGGSDPFYVEDRDLEAAMDNVSKGAWTR